MNNLTLVPFLGYSGNFIRNNLLATIDQWGPQYRLSLDFKIHSNISSGWSSLVAFKGNGGEQNNQNYGDRNPAIFYYQNTGKLSIRNSVSGNKNFALDYEIDVGSWYSIEMVQKETDGKVRQSLKI